MKIEVIYPSGSHSAYKVAASEFSCLANAAAGCSCDIIADDGNPSLAQDCDLTVIIGSDAVNSVAARLYLTKSIDSLGIRYGTDDYLIRSQVVDGRRTLLLAGGRPRATIYAVYRYFELFCGCRWFWDGDRIPHSDLAVDGIDVIESPRFDYRGIRYFAHRGLHRFQAEHWSYEDWCREIDWILKSRLNLFMLRIGTDDLFQRAFPDIVGYPKPDEPLPEAGLGYDDRNLFWSLEYRGKLRQRILRYAFERDLIHPEDTGTMTHWYSRTPIEFLDKMNPKLLSQSISTYSEQTGLVFDIREKECMDYYFKLTDTHIKEYGRPEMFHTIGLAERLFSDDKEENMRLKLYVYRTIALRLKEKYPNAPLLIASWDLWQRYTPDEVQRLVAELDPSQAIIFDYTSDTTTENNFTNWGVVGKFPWIFGIFSGYEPNSEIRGLYELTNERLKIAKSDPMCKGMVLWPELSHGDPFIIYYLTKNVWSDEVTEIKELIRQYCADRYPDEIRDEMTAIWHTFLPVASLKAWSTTKDELYDELNNTLFARIYTRARFERERREEYRTKLISFKKQRNAAVAVLDAVAKMHSTDEMTLRDLYDIIRTVIGNYIDAAILLSERIYAEEGSAGDLSTATESAETLLELLTDLLASSGEFRLYDTLEMLKRVTDTNPHFEITLKRNTECNYCRSYIYENAEYLYLPEMRYHFERVRASMTTKGEITDGESERRFREIRERYFELPLGKPRRAARSLGEIAALAAEKIRNINL